MLGWHISIYRIPAGACLAGTASVPELHAASRRVKTSTHCGHLCGTPIGPVWQTHLYGLRWIDQLAEDGLAIELPGNGYRARTSLLVEAWDESWTRRRC